MKQSLPLQHEEDSQRGEYLIDLRTGTQVHQEGFIHFLREVLWIDRIILKMKPQLASIANPCLPSLPY